ncbi:hypothetical protein NEDG_00184 [Nematocida displodere]|uniref:Uncharacterized protein n=1 Tax=Nematocida displodere TaxID=1805483 RepID=A0A177EL52_9MICR|nr:hypothetical protein NEDG_00184 [Nematocida displodere]
MQYACEQVSLPLCSVLFKNRVHAKYSGRAVQMGRVNLYSPYTLILLTIVLWLNLLLVERTRRLYSFPARKEIMLFLRMYSGVVLFDLLLSAGVVKRSWTLIYATVVSLQLSFFVGSFVAALCSGLVWMLPNRMSSFCSSISRSVTFGSFLAALAPIFLCILFSFGFGIFIILYIVPAVCSFFFMIAQFAKLAQLNLEIWSYGSVFITAGLVLLIAATPYILGMVIVLVSDRYLDGVFLMHALGFLAVLKVYNLWMIDNEKEIENVNTVQKW